MAFGILRTISFSGRAFITAHAPFYPTMVTPHRRLRGAREGAYRGGIASNVFSMFSSTASVERTLASR